MKPTYDVTGIGNAIIDIIAMCDEAFLKNMGIERGSMTLIEQKRARLLAAAMGQYKQISGGSAANTMAGFASFGGKGAYMGLVSKDVFGDEFVKNIKSIGLDYYTPRSTGTKETARCYIFVTPDGERSMSTFLGASSQLSENHIDETMIQNSAIIYLEGYLFDKAPAKAAFRKATRIAHAAGRRVALTLSDSFCVHRHRNDFLKLIEKIDILFANEDELKSLYETDDFEMACKKIRDTCDIVAVTRGEKGSIIISGDQTIIIKADPVEQIIDSTGAGDQYAAGFLYGLTTGKDLATCGLYASKAAAQVIAHVGPRPETSYAILTKAA